MEKEEERDDEWLIESINQRAKKRKSGLADPSVIIPINKAFEVSQKVLPSKQVFDILSNAKTMARTDCDCRSKPNACDAPLNVCIVLNSLAEKLASDNNNTDIIDIEEAKQILDATEDAGLIHLIINQKGFQPEAICSCCHCCCHELKALLEHNDLGSVLQSDYITKKDTTKCINCGECITHCHFHAHTESNNEIIYSPEKCYGCGLCIASCPTGALELVEKECVEGKDKRSVDQPL